MYDRYPVPFDSIIDASFESPILVSRFALLQIITLSSGLSSKALSKRAIASAAVYFPTLLRTDTSSF